MTSSLEEVPQYVIKIFGDKNEEFSKNRQKREYFKSSTTDNSNEIDSEGPNKKMQSNANFSAYKIPDVIFSNIETDGGYPVIKYRFARYLIGECL